MNVDTETETAKVLGITAPHGKSPSVLWINQAVMDGLPISALERLVHQVAPDDNDFIYKFVSRPTLARRRKVYVNQPHTDLADAVVRAKGSQGNANRRVIVIRAKSWRLADEDKQIPRQQYQVQKTSRSHGAVLSPIEGAKVARLAQVWAMARQVWGNDSDARAFLFRPHPLLENTRPIDVVLESEFGRPIVEQILGRLQYGSAA